MTYQEIKTALKSFQAQGHAIPPLNSKREILEAALLQLQALTTEQPITSVKEAQSIDVVESQFIPVVEKITTQHEVIPQWITPEHPALSELKELARLTEITLIWGIAVIKSVIRFSTPYLIRGAEIALRIAVYAAVIFREWLLPKLILRGYQLATWGVTIAETRFPKAAENSLYWIVRR